MKKILLLLLFVLISSSSFAQADVLIVNSDNKSYYTPGSTNTYSIIVTNNGTATAANVVITNPIPNGIINFSWVGPFDVAANDYASGINSALNYTIPSLAKGQILTFTVTIVVPISFIGNLTTVANVSTTSADSNPTNNQSSDTDVLGFGADIVVTNSNNQLIYTPGATSIYTLKVKNNGPNIGQNILVTNAIPAGISQFSWTGSNASIGTNVALTNIIPTLAIGNEIIYTITVTIPATFTGNLTSIASTSSTTIPDPVTSCANCIDIDQQLISADLAVNLTDNVTTFTSGGTNNYVLTVINNGPSVANNVIVRNNIPSGINQFSWTGSNGSSGLNSNLYNVIPSMAVGASVTYNITVQIPTTYNITTLQSNAIVTSNTPDQNPACANCSDTDTLNAFADISIVNTDNETIYVPGTTSIYTLTATNNGPNTATVLNIQNAIPSGIIQFSWIGSNGSNGTNVALNNTIPTLAVGQSVSYTITIQVPLTFTGSLTNTASYTTLSTDPSPSCVTCVDVNNLATGADIVVTNTDNVQTYIPGTSNIYTVNVKNNGPNIADVSVQNLIPPGITQFSWVGSNASNGTDIPLNDVLINMAIGASVTYTITVIVPATFTGNLTSQVATSSTSTLDPILACVKCTDTDTPLNFSSRSLYCSSLCRIF